jgi:membrane protein
VGVLANLLSHYAALKVLVLAPINFTFSFIIISLLFAAIYKVLPNKRLEWRDVVVGACGTALLFQGGQALIGIYLANFVTANIYGAAGGLIVLLIWVYYSAQILLLGAEFTKVWARHYGSQTDGADMS